VVLDLFSRRIVGRAMRSQMTADLVTDALMMALWRRGRPRELLHHSDRGSQYTSEQCQRLMAEYGVVCSLSRSGNVWDNAAMESFFSSLKTERTAGKTYRTRDQARADVFDYIERFYNPRRRNCGCPGGSGISQGYPRKPVLNRPLAPITFLYRRAFRLIPAMLLFFRLRVPPRMSTCCASF
jgi:transposase InsO family protein